jgi:hypothetical protein
MPSHVSAVEYFLTNVPMGRDRTWGRSVLNNDGKIGLVEANVRGLEYRPSGTERQRRQAL